MALAAAVSGTTRVLCSYDYVIKNGAIYCEFVISFMDIPMFLPGVVISSKDIATTIPGVGISFKCIATTSRGVVTSS